MYVELRFFFSAHHLKVVYTCIKFHENILNSLKVIKRTFIFIGKNSKGHSSVKNVGGVTVLFLCTLSDGGLYFYIVS